MLLPADRLLQLLQIEFARPGVASDAGDVSSRQSSAMALQLLAQRERAGIKAVHQQFERLISVLTTLSSRLPASATALRQSINDAINALRADSQSTSLTDIEATWWRVLQQVETITAQLRDVQGLDATIRTQLIDMLAAWESDDLVGQPGPAASSPATTTEPLGDASLAAYLRDRFADPGLQVTSFRPLPGGFGKLTYLFDVAGDKFSGSFVMRRDFMHPLLGNDCHCIDKEFEVIRAVHDRGFPAPEALWLDTEHRLLPGGDFIVMRRSPGVSGGTVLKPSAMVADDMVEKLAVSLAGLHALPPLTELSALTESINQQRGAMPLGDCVKAYLGDWRQMLMRTSHLPSPATMSQLDWVLDNVPAMPGMSGKPVLVHGDVGFHNFLIDDGQLTTLLDWEFAHLGDPAEDLASIRNNMGDTLDWKHFIASYQKAGGAEIDMSRVHFFQVWGHVRNALASILSAPVFIEGRVDDIKFVVTPHIYVPMFIRSAQALINAGKFE